MIHEFDASFMELMQFYLDFKFLLTFPLGVLVILEQSLRGKNVIFLVCIDKYIFIKYQHGKIDVNIRRNFFFVNDLCGTDTNFETSQIDSGINI